MCSSDLTWDELRQRQPASFLLVAHAYAEAALACGHEAAARATLLALLEQLPSIDLLQALARLNAQPPLGPYLRQHRTLSAALQWLEQPPAQWDAEGLDAVRDAVGRAARPLQRYRCAACGFEAQHYFWQCPGCLNWGSYPPQRVEEL